MPTDEIPTPRPQFARIDGIISSFGIARSRIYELIGSGKVIARKDGATTLIDVASVSRYVENLPAAQVRPPRARAQRIERPLARQ